MAAVPSNNQNQLYSEPKTARFSQRKAHMHREIQSKTSKQSYVVLFLIVAFRRNQVFKKQTNKQKHRMTEKFEKVEKAIKAINK